jgi:hypothetical protein
MQKKNFKATLKIMVQSIFRWVYLEYIMAIYGSILRSLFQTLIYSIMLQRVKYIIIYYV